MRVPVVDVRVVRMGMHHRFVPMPMRVWFAGRIGRQVRMLVMFIVASSNMHFICPVAPIATGKRLTINGFWSRAERNAPSVGVSPASVLSPRAYGPPAPPDEEGSPIAVL